ncbi:MULTISPECIES: AbiJ-NTD4 domain-containing protein [Olivibacter]|uniref:AbiJ-NTD4 domain-containing protein n=1 Tax=Olivibacter jilunii TaxID=985016 RepID=A0ABW6B347_9SPHI|nr:hypothetical protein [Pseudosphingobacterium sp.]
MKSFSQRIGLKPVREIIQRESADAVLRNQLWNALTIFYLKRFGTWISETDKSIYFLINRIWVKYYGNRLDELDSYTPKILNKLKDDFLTSSWNEMFDILEFIPNNYELEVREGGYDNKTNKEFYILANKILEQNLSAYRFVDKLITEISSEEEMSSIEEAAQQTSKYKPVQTHLRRALELLSDRKSPDYRNSIKESISAIESFCCIATNNPKATLGQALKEAEKRHEIHPALKNSFSSLYGYTSDGGGIRHSLLSESSLKQEDAKFMLVACSAFVNYLLVKTSELD